MITKIEVKDPQGNTLLLPLQDNSSGLTVRKIEGLDPVKATIVSSAFAQLDGSQQQGARRENRNIVMTVGMEPYSGGTTVSALRAQLYAYLLPKSFVTLRFFADGASTPYAVIDGQVESFEAPLFVKDPEVNVSIISFDPAFSAPSATDIVAGWNSVNVGAAGAALTYPGTIEVGAQIVLNVNRTLSAFSIINVRAGLPDARFDATLALASGDKVVVNGVARNKYVTRAVGVGAPASILYAATNTSKFPTLYPGLNTLRVEHTASGAGVPFEIHYTAKYGGL